jgi:hypothetical protein
MALKKTAPKSPKKKVKRVKKPRTKGSPIQITWQRAKEQWERGNFFKAVHGVSVFATGVGTGMLLHPKTSSVGQYLTGISAGVAVASGVAYHKKRIAFRDSPRNPKNIDRVFKTENKDWLRQMDYEFVRRYYIDPRGTERSLLSTTAGTAEKFISNRGLRKAPNALYRIEAHEHKSFSSLVKPLLQYKIGQLQPDVNGQEALDHHFPPKLNPKQGEKERLPLKPITDKSKLPPEIIQHIPRRLLTAHPETTREAVALAVLAASIAKSKLNDVENTGR